MTSADLEERRKSFFRTLRAKNWGNLIVTICVGVVFIVYFIQLIVYQHFFKGDLQKL